MMRHLPGPQQQAFKELQGLEDFIAKKVEENQLTLDPNSPRHFIDSFLIRVQEVRARRHAVRIRAKQRELRLWARQNRGPFRLPTPYPWAGLVCASHHNKHI